MSNISELTLTKIVNGIKKKEFSSEEVTNSFIKNSPEKNEEFFVVPKVIE